MPTFQTRDLVDSLIREALTAYAATVLSLMPNILITLSPLSRRSSHYSFLTQLLDQTKRQTHKTLKPLLSEIRAANVALIQGPLQIRDLERDIVLYLSSPSSILTIQAHDR